MPRLGILPLGRATFDVPFAEEKLGQMLAALDASGHELVGPRTLLMDADATRAAIDALKGEAPDQVLILQVTFTDAAMTLAIANAFPDVPLSIWAVPEPRLGGRLRLNAFCGLNLASHALGLAGRDFGWLYVDAPEADLSALLGGARMAGRLNPVPPQADAALGAGVAQALAGQRIGRIGAHPDGFETCAYDAEALKSLTGVEVEALELDQLFDTARAAAPEDTAAVRAATAAELPDLDQVDQEQLDRSLALRVALDQIRAKGRFDAFAIRCWPETFTEYGGAVCGPVAQLGEARVPCACEADVYGALTQLMLQEVAKAPVFLVDLVDIDADDDTGVVWHCGQAPLSMADADTTPSATIHTNRKMPLLYEFALKPGTVTFARISQAHGSPRLVIARGEMLKRPMAFTGTSGTVRFDAPAGKVLERVIGAGLEHHMGLVYGDYAAALHGVAAALGLPVLDLGDVA
ncbi:L-fucose/L-arabinose isomerase family protein [Oceanibium sediminis]|uniref:L-fucose/L-arabinose isomerase family protein n=1 Tax=Oceanibium sediminis TaxID=2026339 RepID=UPI000DD362EB|nr:hypothetical protein [Oceanibium sediminis]